jgi:hypothetical protein
LGDRRLNRRAAKPDPKTFIGETFIGASCRGFILAPRASRADDLGVTSMPNAKHAKDAAEHHAAAAKHHERAAEHHRQASTHHELHEYEKAAHHSVLAHAHSRHAEEHHDKAAKLVAELHP